MAEAQRRRVVTSALTFERPTDTTRPEVHGGLLTSLVIFVFRPLWAYRVELGLLALVFCCWASVATNANPVIASVTVLAAVGALLGWSRSRSYLGRLLRSRFCRRAFDRACRYGLVVSMNDRTPRPLKVRETPAGHVLSVQMPPSMSTLPLADASEVIAAGMSVREVRVVRDSSRADRATVSIIRRDPLGDGSVLSWPHISADRLSIWDDIPVGLDEMGEVVYINLVESNELIAGEPGAGKSVKQSILVATAALDPGCDLYLFDGNRVEFSPWRSCAVSFVGPSVEETTEALRDLVSEMNRRYEVLERTGKRKIERGDGLRPIVIVINELAHYLSSEDPKSDKVVAGLLRRLVAQGRAAGVITVVATQKPSADVIPTYLRDLFAYRCALRCTTPQASDTVLGQGWASAGFSASDIDSSCRGVGYLLSEGSEPRRMKAFYLSDSEIGALAIRGSAIREVEREVRRIDPAA